MSDFDNESLEEIAARVKAAEQGLREDSEDAAPKKKRGRPRKNAPEAAPAVEEEAQSAYDPEQFKQLLSMALTATGSLLTTHFELVPDFSNEQGDALADAWIPVLEYYAGAEMHPLIPAIATTGIVLLPYGIQLGQRYAVEKAKTVGREVSRV